MKTRKLVKQSPIRASTLSYSHYYKLVAGFESSLEIDHYNLLMFEQKAITVITQHKSFEYKLNGRYQRYTPDVFVVVAQEYVIEVKYLKDTLKEDFIAKSLVLKTFFETQGLTYQVVTEIDIRVGSRAANLRYIKPALRQPAPLEALEQIIESVPSRNASLLELQEIVSALNLDPSFIRKAIAHKLITCDLTQPWLSLQLSW